MCSNQSEIGASRMGALEGVIDLALIVWRRGVEIRCKIKNHLYAEREWGI